MIFRTITNDITGANKSIGLFGKSLNDFKGIISSFKQNGIVSTLFNTPLINIDTNAINRYNAAIRSGITFEKALATARKSTNAETIALIESSNGAEVQIERVSAAQKASTIAAKAQSVALKAASIAGNMLAMWAISKAIDFVATEIDNYVHKAEKARERTSELFDEFKEMNNTLANHKKTVSELADRYDELSKGVNLSTNANSFLSTEEYEEFLDINEQLANSFPELVKGIAENGNSILTLGTKGITAKKQLEELLQTEEDLNNFRIAQGLDEAFKGVYTYIENANEATAELEDSILDLNEYISGWQRVTEKGIVFEDNIYQFDGKYHESYGKYNEIQYQYMKTIEDSVDEFWRQLDKSRQAELSEKGYNLYSVDSDANGFKLYVNTFDLKPEEIAELERIIQNNITNISTTALDSLGEQETKLQKQIQDAENAWVDYLPNLISGMKSMETFKRLDPELQDMAEKIVESFDYHMGEEMNQCNGYDDFIRQLIINPMSALSEDDKSKVKDAFNELMALDAEDISQTNQSKITGLIDDIATLLGKDSSELRIAFGFDGGYDAKKRLNNSIRSIADADREQISILNEFTLSQVELWLEATLGAKNATEAIQMYKDKLTELEESAKSQPLSTKLTNSADSLDKFQSSVKSAADAYATLLSGNYSSTELLDSIQAINNAVTDMGGTLDWEFINKQSTMDSLELLGGAIGLISEDYTKSVLSGAGIDVNSDFGKMLANIVQQAYEVEAKFTGMNAQLDNLQSSYQTLTGILESYNETGHISLDNLQSLLTADENLITMLEVENGQLVINQAAYENLVAAQLLEFKAKLDDAAAAEIEALAKAKSEEATNNNAKASEDAVSKLDAETEAFKRNTEAAGENAITKAIADAEEAGVSEEEIQRVLDKYTEIWNAAKDNYSTDFPAFMNGAKSGASFAGEAAGKSAGEAFTEALDKELTALDKKLEAGYIDFNDYLQSRLSLIEDYYNQSKLSADEYYSYLEKHYDTQLSYMDKAVNAVTRRIDAELDALKQQKEDVENIYKVRIESLEKEKNLLEEANRERQRQKDLQKSLYDLEKAKNQRTQLIYTEDKGMQYVADDQSIRDAQESVDNAGYDIKISEIEKSISNLEESRDKETNAIDEMISNLESYKDAWNDVTSAYEEEQENLFAAQILGADWEADILSGRLDVLNAFKNEYIRIQQEIADAVLKSANEQVKAAKEAEKGSSGSTPNAPKIDSKKDQQKKDLPQLPTTSSGGDGGGSHSLGLGGNKLVYANLKAYASGTNNAKKGLNLVGEDGTEAYFDNHGHVAIVTKPTLIPMEGGEVVKNERDTKKLLDPDNLAPVDTIEPADIDGKETLPDVRTLPPISLEEYIQELRQIAPALSKQVQTKQIYPETDLLQRPERCVPAMERSLESMMNPMNLITHNMQELTGMGNHMNHINNVRNAQPVINGGINITCPGVTSKEVAKQLPGVLNEALEREFSGLHLQAMQWT